MRQRPICLLSEDLVFPPVSWARPDGLLAVGGDLSIERLLLAYKQGIFPWPLAELPEQMLMWWSPPERAIIEPNKLHVGRSLRKVVQRGSFQVRFDTAFAEVIKACASTPRPEQPGTWITPEMVAAYIDLHRAGFAHSVECYQNQTLCGGLYGVSLGGCFFGESMFSHADDASKVAFVALSERLHGWNFDLIDCQIQNNHLERFGVEVIPRAAFLSRLAASMQRPTRRGSWQES